MAATLRPLQPCLKTLLRAPVPAAARTCLRASFAHLPIRCRIKHGVLLHSGTRAAARRCLSTSGSSAATSSETDRVLSLARQAVQRTFTPNSVVDVSGHGSHMGMDIAWQLKLRQDGAFLERISGKELNFSSGCNAGPRPTSWEVDDTSLPKQLQLDDDEACLISAWVKSGMWLSPDISQVLDIQVLSEQSFELPVTDIPPASATAAASTQDPVPDASLQERPADSLHDPPGGPSTSDTPPQSGSSFTAAPHKPKPDASPSTQTAAASGSSDLSTVLSSTSEKLSKGSSKGAVTSARVDSTARASSSDHSMSDAAKVADTGNQHSCNGSSNSHDSGGVPSHIDSDRGDVSSASTAAQGGGGHAEDQDSSAPSEGQSRPYVLLAVKLKTGQVECQVRLSRETWQPMALLQPVCGEVVTWQYLQWREWHPGFSFPTEHHHLAPSGTYNIYTTTAASTSPAPQLSTFVMPTPPLTPPDTKFDPGASADVEAWHTGSGHVLVQAKINGKEAGYMMLDTGASGLVIEEETANELGLQSFGNMYVAGMGARLLCQFRRGQELTVGPVSIQRPLFMQMSLSGVVNGAPGPVVGILGYDLFRRCVMQLPPSSHDTTNAPFTLTFHDPSTYTLPPKGLPYKWQPLVMVANLPHVEALLCVTEGGEPVQCLLMLDSGAGGVDAMFHARAVQELGLAQTSKHGLRILRGVGGSAVGGMRARSGELHSIDLSGHQFHKLKCLFTDSDALDHTLYSSGILCGDIISRCGVILDYPRSRMMFIPQDSAD